VSLIHKQVTSNAETPYNSLSRQSRYAHQKQKAL